MYCLCVNLYCCHRVTTQSQLTNISNEAAWAGFGSYRHRGLNNDYYKSADKSLARSTSRYIFFDGENISFDASLVFYI
jgi:hypothetical protein